MKCHLLWRSVCGTALVAVAMLLVAVAPASAVQTGQYDHFDACPTGAPELNDPGHEIAVCVFGAAREAKLEIGKVSIPLSQMEAQFATTEIDPEEPECPQLEACLGRVPGTTTLKAPPSVIRFELSHHDHGRGGDHWKGRWRKRTVRLELTVESAGDVRAVSPAFIFGAPIPVYKLPVKIHVEGPGLGRRCYVGSEKEPILLAPMVTGPPGTAEFLTDPNGFKTELLKIIDVPMADTTLAVPAADRCGHGRRYGFGALDTRDVNSLLGVPSPAGANTLSLPHSDLEFAVAAIDGTPSGGGAELQAAFEAARE